MERMYDVRRYDTNFMSDAVIFLKTNKAGAATGGPQSSMLNNSKRSNK